MFLVFCSCHGHDGGPAKAACCNFKIQPPKLINEHNFPTAIVNAAADLMHKHFKTEEVGWCRVFEFGGFKHPDGKMEPIMYYVSLDENGEEEVHNSSLVEVAEWVAAEPTNVL